MFGPLNAAVTNRRCVPDTLSIGTAFQPSLAIGPSRDAARCSAGFLARRDLERDNNPIPRNRAAGAFASCRALRG